MTQGEILQIFTETEALLKGHFQLTSGLHSAQYFQCAKVLQYPRYAELLCGEIARHFSDKKINVVISPAIGGIVVGQEVGRQLGVRTMFAERANGLMQLRRGFEIRPQERVLVCEDVITTGGSAGELIKIVKRQGSEVVGVGSIVDRSGGTVDFPTSDQFSLLRLTTVSYQPNECPLCKQNIPISKQGSRQ